MEEVYLLILTPLIIAGILAYHGKYLQAAFFVLPLIGLALTTILSIFVSQYLNTRMRIGRRFFVVFLVAISGGVLAIVGEIAYLKR